MENDVDRMLVDLNRTLVVEEPVEDTKPAQSKQASVHYWDTDILSALRVESGARCSRCDWRKKGGLLSVRSRLGFKTFGSGRYWDSLLRERHQGLNFRREIGVRARIAGLTTLVCGR
jgi:hypothetical protein